jgi:hypothetical protein
LTDTLQTNVAVTRAERPAWTTRVFRSCERTSARTDLLSPPGVWNTCLPCSEGKSFAKIDIGAMTHGLSRSEVVRTLLARTDLSVLGDAPPEALALIAQMANLLSRLAALHMSRP